MPAIKISDNSNSFRHNKNSLKNKVIGKIQTNSNN
jgi:hypothetical protein